MDKYINRKKSSVSRKEKDK